MKICYISVATFPSRTAHTSYTSNLARALARNCDHVRVIGWEGLGRDPCVDEATATDNLAYLLLRGPSASASRRVWAMGFATVRHAPMWSARVDRVITHSPVVAAALRTRKIPFVLDVHGTSDRARITRYALSGNVVRGCIFNSQQMSAICQKAWGVEHLPGLVLGSGINYAQLTNLPPRSLALAESGISPDRMVIGYIGSLGPGRGIDLLLNAALAMQAQHPSLVWLFVGGNPDDVAKWQAYAVDLGLPPNCFCFVGHQQQDSLARFYSLADILVAPYSRLIKDANTMAPMKLVE